jgi:hypothetical protein
MKMMLSAFVLAILCSACSKSDSSKTDRPTTPQDADYELKPQTKADVSSTNYSLIDWGSLIVSNTQYSLTFTLKTEWKNGMAHYALIVSPYEGMLEAQYLHESSLEQEISAPTPAAAPPVDVLQAPQVQQAFQKSAATTRPVNNSKLSCETGHSACDQIGSNRG